MSYDDTSFYGDMIVEEYDEQNNFMNPISPFGFLVYHLLGDGFDIMSSQCEQWMNDFDILTANTKGLDNYWGVSYNMPRPKIVHQHYVVFEDGGTSSNHNDTGYSIPTGELTMTRLSDKTSVTTGENGANLQIGGVYTQNYQWDFDYIPSDNVGNSRIYVFGVGGTITFSLSNFSSECHLTLKKEGTSTVLYKDGSLYTSFPSAPTTNIRLRVAMQSNRTIYFKNMKVTEWEDGVRFCIWRLPRPDPFSAGRAPASGCLRHLFFCGFQKVP